MFNVGEVVEGYVTHQIQVRRRQALLHKSSHPIVIALPSDGWSVALVGDLCPVLMAEDHG